MTPSIPSDRPAERAAWLQLLDGAVVVLYLAAVPSLWRLVAMSSPNPRCC